jgi:putative redox protein
MITARARRIGALKAEVEVDGHTFVVDEPVADGGTDEGPSPTRLLTASLASCTAITIQMYAGRKGWDMDGLEVAAEFDGSPKGADTAHFRVHLTLPPGLDEEQVDRIRTIAAKCPVHRTLTGRVEIGIDDAPAAGASA